MHTFPRTATPLQRGIANLLTMRPLCVSFEIIHNCNTSMRASTEHPFNKLVARGLRT